MVGPGIGNAQDSVIAGTADADELTGTVGDDTINGRGGADVMTGLAGNDTYIVDDEADQVVEQAGEGNDTVRVFGWYQLPDYVNNLIVAGSQDGGGHGNNLANRMIGNSGSNTFNGEPGNDTLTGRGGADDFHFSSPLNGTTNVDRVTDFTVGVDSLVLWWLAFPAFVRCDGLNAPDLAPSRLHIGVSATTDSHRIVYNPNSGALNYDSDGSGPTPAVRFATLSPDLALTGDDFRIFSRTSCP
jgi:Ca2+-binding RTX toxin-like protein